MDFRSEMLPSFPCRQLGEEEFPALMLIKKRLNITLKILEQKKNDGKSFLNDLNNNTMVLKYC